MLLCVVFVLSKYRLICAQDALIMLRINRRAHFAFSDVQMEHLLCT